MNRNANQATETLVQMHNTLAVHRVMLHTLAMRHVQSMAKAERNEKQ
jgi:hypothetical protein